MKKWSNMTVQEKLDVLLEHESKTHDKIVEMIDVINNIIDFMVENEGQAMYRIEPLEKRKTIN